jgi:CRP-like cAMP-binding protein
MEIASDLVKKEQFAKGSLVFSQGDAGEAAFIVEAGSIGIFKILDNGEKVHLATLKKGELFGEMAVIDGSNRMAAAVALENSTVVRIPRETFDVKLKQYDPFMRALIEILISNLRGVHRVYMKRPRTAMEMIEVQSVLAESVRKFVDIQPPSDTAREARTKLDGILAALGELRPLIVEFPERRESVMSDRDLHPPHGD